MKVRFLFWCLLLPIWCSAVQPYTPVIADPILEPWRWRHEEALDGLGVLCMDEAADGTLWFGCVGSIASYDGVTVTRVPFDETLLSKVTLHRETPWAKVLLTLPNGNLLVLMGRSLVLRAGEEWQVILQDAGMSTFEVRLLQSDDGTLWLLVSDALWRIDADLSVCSKVIETAGDHELLSGCIDLMGNLWVVEQMGGSDSRLIQITVQNGRPAAKIGWRKFAIPFDDNSREAHIVAGDDGLIWYANNYPKADLQAFDPQRGQWVQRPAVDSPHAYFSILKSHSGTVFAGSTGGIQRMMPEGKQLFSSHEELELPRVPLSFFETGNQRLWVIGRVGYVYSVDLGQEEWRTYSGLNFQCETEAGVQWFRTGSPRYVVSYDPRSGEWYRYGPEDNLLSQMLLLIHSSHGLVWGAGVHDGRAAIAVFDGVRWTRICHPEFAHWIRPNSAFEAADGTLWFGAGGRLLSEVPGAGGALQYKVNPDRSVELVKHYSPPDFPYYVTAFEQTPNDALWVGSTRIHCYDDLSQPAHPLPELQGENTVAMTLDQQQALWIAKEHLGVCRWLGDSWEVFTPDDGLASRMPADLLLLRDGSLMVSSDQGISRFDGTSWTTHAYSEQFAMLTRWSGMRQSEDGAIWFNYLTYDKHQQKISPETQGYCTIRHRPETNPPDTQFVDYLERVAPPGNSHITWSARDVWSDTPLDELQYSWRLNEGEWSAFSHETSQIFLKLKSGRHVMEVRARDRAFNVDPMPARVEFFVVPPLWKQAWFLMMVFGFLGLVLLLTWLLIRARERHLLDQQKHLMEMDRMKTGFFTNVSHELRTPVTVISGRLQSILNKDVDDQTRESLSIVMRNAQRVSTLVTQLLDFRKIEEGKIQAEATRGDLVPLLRDWVASLRCWRSRRNSLFLWSVWRSARGYSILIRCKRSVPT